MSTIKVFDLLNRRALITRESARELEKSLRFQLESGDLNITLDFKGIDAVTPSFVDETLSIVEIVLDSVKRGTTQVVFSNPPTRLSSKFEAIARAHGAEIAETAARQWVIRSLGKGVHRT